MKQILLGLTGQSGAGKSTIARILEQHGAYVIDCDKLARYVVEPGKPALLEIAEAFGADVLNPDGTMNRTKVASIVFSDEASLHKLNQITHKYIEEEIDGILLKVKNPLIVIDAPVLFESGMHIKCHKVLGVLADRKTRILRIMERDGLSRQKAEERIFAQHDDDFYRSRCDFLLENNGTAEELEVAVSQILQEVFA